MEIKVQCIGKICVFQTFASMAAREYRHGICTSVFLDECATFGYMDSINKHPNHPIFFLEKGVKHRYDRPYDRPRRFAMFDRKPTLCDATHVNT